MGPCLRYKITNPSSNGITKHQRTQSDLFYRCRQNYCRYLYINKRTIYSCTSLLFYPSCQITNQGPLLQVYNMASRFSRIAEKDNVLCIDEDQYTSKPVSNFVINIICEVEAGAKSGFLWDVTYFNGENLG